MARAHLAEREERKRTEHGTKRLVLAVFKFGFIKPGMSGPTVNGSSQAVQQHPADICICRQQGNGLILTCQGPQCPYHNEIHPECFGMTKEEIERAYASPQ